MAPDALTRGREAYQQLAWRAAYEHLSTGDQQDSLDAANDAWERTHHAYLDRGDIPPAVRCAFWLGLTLVLRGQHARGGGSLGRARHILEEASLDCVEQGYLRLPMEDGAQLASEAGRSGLMLTATLLTATAATAGASAEHSTSRSCARRRRVDLRPPPGIDRLVTWRSRTAWTHRG